MTRPASCGDHAGRPAERNAMDDLKPLHEIVKPGVPCEVWCGGTIYGFDGHQMRADRIGQILTRVDAMLEPRWRLVPPAPLLKWDPDPEAFVAGEYTIRKYRIADEKPWFVERIMPGGDAEWFRTRDECEQWAEDHARKNR